MRFTLRIIYVLCMLFEQLLYGSTAESMKQWIGILCSFFIIIANEIQKYCFPKIVFLLSFTTHLEYATFPRLPADRNCCFAPTLFPLNTNRNAYVTITIYCVTLHETIHDFFVYLLPSSYFFCLLFSVSLSLLFSLIKICCFFINVYSRYLVFRMNEQR